MPRLRSILVVSTALTLATALTLSIRAGWGRTDLADGLKAYHRPAALDGSSDKLDNDRVWALGRKLFFDTRLSASSTISCASCHQPDQSWTDHLPKAVGDAHKPLAFRAPTLLNASQIDRYGWTGRFPDIEAVAFFAMSSPANMNVPTALLLGRLAADPLYVADFHNAFADGQVSKHNTGLALSRFIRSITSAEAPFDRWVSGDETAIDPAAKRGFAIFDTKAKCSECHSGWALTDGSFHDIGIGKGADIGRGAIFKTSAMLKYAFKTPTLRNVAERAPYMHDGSLATLEAVIDHYDHGGIDRPSRAEGIRPLQLSPQEKSDLVAFLRTLSSDTQFVAQSAN